MPPTLPQERLPGAWIDSGDPDEYGVTILPDYDDEAMNIRHHYSGQEGLYSGNMAFSGGWWSLWS